MPCKEQVKLPVILIITVILTLGLSISFQSLLADWTAPLASPPTQDINPPIYNNGTLSIPIINYPFTVNDNFYVGTDNFFVNNTSGNVGIGTTDPGAKLDVSGNSLVTGNTYIGSTDSYFYRDSANRIATPDQFYVQSSSANTYLYSTNTYLGGSSGDSIHLRGNTFDWNQGVIQGNGNVGIGTTEPTGTLHVKGGSWPGIFESKAPIFVLKDDNNIRTEAGFRAHFQFDDKNGRPAGKIGYPYDSDTYMVIETSVGGIVFRTGTGGSSSPRMTVDSDGNVGIGTTEPGAKLEVDGKIKAQTPLDSDSDDTVATKGYVDAASGGGPGEWECTGVNAWIGSGCTQSSRTVSANCPSGYTLISGACTVGSTNSAWRIFASWPENNRWYCSASSGYGTCDSAYARAWCCR